MSHSTNRKWFRMIPNSTIHCLQIHVARWALPPSVNSQVASLRQQHEEFQGRRGGDGRGGGGRDGPSVRGDCGPEAPCSRSLAAMEHAQRQALEELQRQHERQMKELENEKNRLLLEEAQDTTRGQHIQTFHVLQLLQKSNVLSIHL